MSKVQELHGVTEEVDPEEMFQSLDMSTVEEQKYDNKEIEKLAKSMQDLAVLFKELSSLVVEQGTIVDRIDYNVEVALTST